MITRNDIRKRRKRLLALVLSIVMVVGLLWMVPQNEVNAVGQAGEVTVDNGGSVDLTSLLDSDMKMIKDDRDQFVALTDISRLVITNGTQLTIPASLADKTVGNYSMVIDAEGGTLINGGTLVCGEFSKNITNNGTFITDTFDSSSFTAGDISNNGTVKADIIKLTTAVQNGTASRYDVSSSSSTNTSVTITGYNSEFIGTISTKPLTKISSDGGTFTLEIGSRTNAVSSADEDNAFELMSQDTTVGSIKYRDIIKNADGFYYSNGDIIVVPVDSGYSIKALTKTGWTEYGESISLTEDDLKFEPLKIYVAKLSGDYPYRWFNFGDSESILEFAKLKIDTNDPEVTRTVTADSEPVTISEGKTITAKKVSITLSVVDPEGNLVDTVETSVGNKTLVNAEDGTSKTVTIEYDADPATTKDHYYMVKDKAGNVSSVGFYLTYKKDEIGASLVVDDIDVGGTINPILTTDHDNRSNVKYYYKSKSDTDYSETPIDTNIAGDYSVRAVIPASDKYVETICDDEFTISRLTPSASVSVAGVKAGDDTYEPVISIDSAWDGSKSDIAYEYKATAADASAYSAVKPTRAGTYMVRAIIPQTNKYNGVVVESASYTISKKTPSEALLFASDVEYGSEIGPGKNLSISTDSDGEVTYKYKLSSEDSTKYTTTIPKDVGEYNVIAYIAESDNYEKTESNEAAFSIKKITVDLGITIQNADNLKVGDEIRCIYTPTFTIPLDVSIVTEFKEKGADDSEYTIVTPNKAGEYTARGTIKDSKIYEDVSVEAGFTISRKTPESCSVNVADIVYGGAVEPVVTTDSDGKDSATFEYKKADAPESAYSSTVPTETGDYSVRATIPETDRYISVQCENTFSIGKIDEDTAKVEVADTVIGTEYTPVLSTASDGKSSATFEYKPVDADDLAYTSAKPTAAGKYMIRATVPETANFKEQICTATFTISKKTPQTADITISDVELGEEIVPILTTDSDGKDSAVFEYKLYSADESEYTTSKPSEEGRYMVRATVPETDTYNSISCEAAFKVGQLKTAAAAVEIPDVNVGTSYEPLLTTDSDGKDKAVFEYRKDGSEDDFTTEKPVKAGKYVVRATVPETDRYKEVSCESTFTINKITLTDSKVKVGDLYVGDEITPVLSTDSDGKDKAVFEYKKVSDKDSEYSETVPTKAGEYSVRATVPETDKYNKVVCEGTFKISKKTPKATIKVGDQHVGVKYKPVLSTDSDGKGKAYFEYKGRDDSDDAYSKEKPVKAGEYMVRATVPETDKYKVVSCEAEYSITYLKNPAVTYKISGTSGKNGYYTSDVYLVAPKGYEIATSEDGEYSERIKYSETVKKIYIKRTSDGALMEEITVGEIKIDKDAPEITDVVDDKNNKVSLSDSSEVYADKLVVSFTDEHLAMVRVNEDEFSPDGDGISITLDADGGDRYFAITAEDMAGNMYSVSLTLKAAWMKTNTIPAGTKVRLVPGRAYKLESGRWTIPGDATVYSGGYEFYVSSEKEIIFDMK